MAAPAITGYTAQPEQIGFAIPTYVAETDARTGSGVEATDQPNEAAARMTDLAQQAARHFEQNDFEKALSVLKELETIANRRRI